MIGHIRLYGQRRFVPGPFPRYFLTLACAAALAGCASDPPETAGPPEALPPKSPWERVVMIGASATAGYTASEPFGGRKTTQYRLDRYLDAALLAPHEPVKNFASAWFFVRPEGSGRHEMNEALAAKPTLVIALDLLFWYVYGDGNTDAERLERFGKGLKLLESVQCPLIVGDVPDASRASQDMLAPEQIPSAFVLVEANRLLGEWAANRPQVYVVPLAGFMAQAMEDQALTVHGHTFPAGKTRELMQEDGLHPTTPGCAILALCILDTFTSTQTPALARDVRWDFGEVLRLGLNSTKPAPAKPADAAEPAGNAQ